MNYWILYSYTPQQKLKLCPKGTTYTVGQLVLSSLSSGENIVPFFKAVNELIFS